MHAAEMPVARVTVLCPETPVRIYTRKLQTNLLCIVHLQLPQEVLGLANMASVTQRELCLPEVVKGTQPRAQAKPKLLGP